MEFYDLAVLWVLDNVHTGDEIGIAQTNFPSRSQAEEFLGRVFTEAFPFNMRSNTFLLPGISIISKLIIRR
jgi:L-fucose mutarotase/ribose pyranase (RbsD/FucU family)